MALSTTEQGWTSSSSSSDESNDNNRIRMEQTKSFKVSTSQIWTGRILFIICLAASVAILGWGGHHHLSESEDELASTQFDSIAERAIHASQELTIRKMMSSVTVASMYSNMFPDAEAWPNVAIPGFNNIAKNLRDATANTGGIGMLPIVTPSQLASFEKFAYDFLELDNTPGTWTSDFGDGVFAIDLALNTSDNRYHDVTGETTWGSPNNVLVPIFQIDGPYPSHVTMLNIHSIPSRGVSIDRLMACVEVRATLYDEGTATGNTTTSEEDLLGCACAALTDAVFLMGLPPEEGPGAVIMLPIYPKNDPTVLTGISTSAITWREVLKNVFEDEVTGVDCVLETETQVFTYTVMDGVPLYIGEGDSHDRHYTPEGRTILLTRPGMFSTDSTSYTLSLYPSSEFYDIYRTNNPFIATVGAVGISLFVSFMFFMYDSLVRKDIHKQKAILDARRQFMRFVCHEVRSPLNTVCMGLRLLEDETNVMFSGSRTTASHSIKLGNIIGKDVNVNGDKAASILELSQQIHANADTAVDILNDLLNYDKIERGQLTLERTILPIWMLIEGTMTEFKLPAKASQIHFSLDFQGLSNNNSNNDPGCLRPCRAKDLPREVREQYVVGDTVRITQVIRNIVSNALKFTPEGGNVTVLVSWIKESQDSAIMDSFKLSHNTETCIFARSGKVQIDVKDSGAGLSRDQVQKLYGEGVQFNVNDLQAGKGSGLGLYIAKGIVEQHGGSMSADSEGLGRGSTFTVTFPLYHIPDPSDLPPDLHMKFAHQLSSHHDSEHHPDRRIDSAAAPGEDDDNNYNNNNNNMMVVHSSLRLLIVDDAVMNRKLLSRLLENRGHSCDLAENGKEAVEKVHQSIKDNHPYDCILLDGVMPIMDGPTTAKYIRHDMGCYDIYIIGITGNVLPEDVAHFQRCGANDVLPKPIKLPRLETLWMEYGLFEPTTITTTNHPLHDELDV